MDLGGKNVVVIGAKASGISARALLEAKGAKAETLTEESEKEWGERIIRDCSLVVPSPGVSAHDHFLEFAKKLNKPVLGEMELGCSFLPAKKIMVTGTNGKTTVVTMIEKLLGYAGMRVKAMGNIGYPVSQVVVDGTELDYAVIEVSSFQLEYVKDLRPDIAVVTNLAPDHLDRYDSYKSYVETKRKLLKNMTEEDTYVFNADDGAARSFLVGCKAKSIPVSTGGKLSPVFVKDNYFMCGDVTVCHVKTTKLRGEHNRFNLLCALNVGALCGVRKENMYRLIKEYNVLPNRIEYVMTLGGVSFYNDSKGTNVHACRKALESMDGSVGLIMGGSSKNEDFCDFFENIDEKVKLIAVTGDNAPVIRNAAYKMGYTAVRYFADLGEAVRYLYESGKVKNVLLSPASASFDRFRNYAERGEKFKEAVYALKK